MNRAKKSIIVFVSMLLFLTLSLSACVLCKPNENLRETEHFRYYVIGNEEAGYYVSISGLTDAGKELEYIVIPDELEGHPVIAINGSANASNLKKIYISKSVETIVRGYWLGVGKEYKTLHTRFNCTNSSVGRFLYPYIPSLAEENYKRIELNYSIANLNYLLNYENSINGGVHFIDDLEVGEKIVVVPPKPIREGYTFKGWYLDEECTEIFDMVNYVRSDDDGIMHVYAGWKEK